MRIVRSLRKLLARIDEVFSHFDRPSLTAEKVPPRERYEEIRNFILSLDQPNDDARAYLNMHIERMVRTLTLVPPPGPTRRALELGAYMQMTPVLQDIFGYEEVRAAYYGRCGSVETKAATIGGQETFRCDVDLFDAEKDTFPYPDQHFDTVLACEIIEHLLHDPMHMLLEIRRVLVDQGTVILTTPNIASFGSFTRILQAHGHPQICSKYADPRRDVARGEVPHVREYTAQELGEAVQAAGFQISFLFTENVSGRRPEIWAREFLQRSGHPIDLRGEQTYCVAHKQAGAPINRYPDFLYEQ